jgi:Bacterial Ig-like domain (group 2).
MALSASVPQRLGAITLIPVLFACAACNASYPFQPSSRTPVVILVVYRFGSIGPINVGMPTAALDAYAIDADGVAEDVTRQATWESSNPNVVQVEQRVPAFTAVAPGIADVIATYQGLSGRYAVRVSEPAVDFPRLSVRGGGPTIAGGTSRLFAGVSFSNGQSQSVREQATWTTADPRIAIVTGERVDPILVGVAPGTTTITATYNGLSASVNQSIYP